MPSLSLSQTFRLVLICLAFGTGRPLLGSALPQLAPLDFIALWSPAVAQTSGGYSRPGGGGTIGNSFGGYSSFDWRPAISGGYGRPSGSAFGGLGLDNSRGVDRAISRRSSSQALQEYRASQTRPALVPLSATRRPSAGQEDSRWATAPLQRRPPPVGWGGGAYAPSYAGAAPRFGAWDAVLAWSLLNSLSRPQSVAYFHDYRNDPRYTQWRAEAERKAASDPAVAQKLGELDALMSQNKAQPASAGAPLSDLGGPEVMFVVVFFGGAVLMGLWLLRRRAAAVRRARCARRRGGPRTRSSGRRCRA